MVTLLSVTNFMTTLLCVSTMLPALFKGGLKAAFNFIGIPFLSTTFELFFYGLATSPIFSIRLTNITNIILQESCQS